MPEPAVPEADLWHDLQPLLDQELAALPDKYRVLIVLCDLEGQTRQEAAGQLGLPEGTVAGRLARARTMLAKRLTRRGLAVSAALLAGCCWRPRQRPVSQARRPGGGPDRNPQCAGCGDRLGRAFWPKE